MLSSSGGTEEANRQRTISTVSSAATATTSAAAGPIVGPLHRFLQFNAALSPSRAAKDGEEKQPEVGNELETLLYWRSLVSSTFAPESLLKFKLYNSESRQEVKNMEVHYSLLPRFLLINYQSGISAIRYLLLNPAERPVGQGAILDVPSTNIIYHFGSGFKVISEGHLRVHYNSQLLITLMEFNTTSFAEYIPRDLFRSENGDVISIPDSPVNEFGLTLKAMRCLEIAEVIYDMRELTIQSITKQLGPKDSLRSLADLWCPRQTSAQQPHSNASPNPQTGGPPMGHVNPSPSFPTPESLAARTPQLVQSLSPEQTAAIQAPSSSNPYITQSRTVPIPGPQHMYHMAGYTAAPPSSYSPGEHFGIPNPGTYQHHQFQAHQQYNHHQQQQHQQHIHQVMMQDPNMMMPDGSIDLMRPHY